MLVCTVIRDRGMRCGRGAISLLTMPLGPGTVLEHLCRAAADAGSDEFIVLTEGNDNRSAVEAVASRLDVTIRALNRRDLNEALAALEPSDRILFVDPRHWPTRGFDFARLQQEADAFSGAIHAIAMGADDTDASERVVIDHDGRVRGIRRFYQRVTRIERPRGSISYSLVPAAALAGCPFADLATLPIALAERGILSRDIPIDCDLFDATNDHDYLALCELTTQRVMSGPTPHDYSRLNPQAVQGRGALVHHSARLVGPVILQAGAAVGPHVTIIGPATIGRGCRIGAGALVAQSVLLEDAVVAAGASVRHRVAGEVVSVEDAKASPHDLWMTDSVTMGETEAVAPELADVGVEQRGLRVAKRAFDILVSGLGLIMLSPLFAVVALLIKFGSPGPVFFVHHREGRGGRRFGCLKFRTMRSDAHQMQRKLLAENDLDGPHFKIARDPRITRIGGLLRKTNVDELPQLFNVLLGHMSLVGPRPSPFRENQICVPWRRARLSVRPGITGLWQICRSQRGEGDFQQWIYYDILYVRYMSMRLDMRTLIATAWTVLTGREVRVESILPGLCSHAPTLRPIAPGSTSGEDRKRRAG